MTKRYISQEPTEIISRRFRGNIKFYKEMVDLFYNSINGEIDIIREAISSKDLERLKFSAHYLKGGASNLGANKVSQIAAQMETLEEEISPLSAEQLFQELKNELKKFRDFTDQLN